MKDAVARGFHVETYSTWGHNGVACGVLIRVVGDVYLYVTQSCHLTVAERLRDGFATAPDLRRVELRERDGSVIPRDKTDLAFGRPVRRSGV